MSTAFVPRDWQLEACAAFATLAARKTNCRAIVSAATGTGKAKLAFLIASVLGGRVLMLAHTDVLCEQLAREAARFFPNLQVGLVKASKNAAEATVVIASVQTLAVAGRLEALVASEPASGRFMLVVCDEAHHAVTGSVYHRVLTTLNDRPALGLTATPHRTRRTEDLGDVWTDGIIHKYLIPQAIRDGVLTPITDGRGGDRPHRLVVPGLDAEAIIAAGQKAEQEGTGTEKEVIGAATWPIVADEVAEATLGLGRRIVVFTPDVASAQAVAAQARAKGVRARAIDGKLSRAEQRAILHDHRAAKLDCVTSCSLLLEGYDDPALTGVVFARMTMSPTLFVQAVGRGLRTAPGKTDCYVSVLSPAYEIHGLVTPESLFLEPAEEPEENEEEEGDGTGGATDEAARWRTFLRSLKGRKSVECAAATNALWLTMYDSKAFVLNGNSDVGMYTVERYRDPATRKETSGWIAWYEPREKRVPSVALTGAVSFDLARRVAEAHARAGEGFASYDAAWRANAPSTRLRNACAAWRLEVPETATAGQLNEALTVAIAKSRRRNRWERGSLIGGAAAFE